MAAVSVKRCIAEHFRKRDIHKIDFFLATEDIFNTNDEGDLQLFPTYISTGHMGLSEGKKTALPLNNII